MSVKDQIIQWAKANYDTSYSAQCAIECYDECGFDRFASLDDFIEAAEIVDDVYEEILATAF